MTVDGRGLGVVVIGRNEGERLRRCLQSLAAASAPVVYVDSGSTDGSQALASQLGVDCVTLDMTLPFTAARGRNRGLDRLREIAPQATFVFFVDGDCEVVSGWPSHAVEFLESHPKAAVVCGRRRERFPERSVYNRMCDVEWDTPPGRTKSCGGDAVMRVAALGEVGAFDPTMVAGEELELSLRLRHAGWEVWRLDEEMTLHDASMTRFSQWWMRSVRGGYGAINGIVRLRECGWNGEEPYTRVTRSARIWGGCWPVSICCGTVAGWSIGGAVGAATSTLFLIGLWLVQLLRIVSHRRRAGIQWRVAFIYGLFTMIAKFAQLQGECRYRWDRLRGRTIRIIEYKSVGASQIHSGTTVAPDESNVTR